MEKYAIEKDITAVLSRAYKGQKFSAAEVLGTPGGVVFKIVLNMQSNPKADTRLGFFVPVLWCVPAMKSLEFCV
jgi:hypothetical protein